MAKTVNYTPEMEVILKNGYDASASAEDRAEQVAALAEKLGKTVPSVRGKLARMGLYVKAEYVSKTGEKPVSKADLVAQIAAKLGVHAEVVESLERATAVALRKVLEAL